MVSRVSDAQTAFQYRIRIQRKAKRFLFVIFELVEKECSHQIFPFYTEQRQFVVARNFWNGAPGRNVWANFDETITTRRIGKIWNIVFSISWLETWKPEFGLLHSCTKKKNDFLSQKNRNYSNFSEIQYLFLLCTLETCMDNCPCNLAVHVHDLNAHVHPCRPLLHTSIQHTWNSVPQARKQTHGKSPATAKLQFFCKFLLNNKELYFSLLHKKSLLIK